MLGPSPSGNVNDFGPSFPFVVPRDDGVWLMYFCAWGSWAPQDELSNRTGLATSRDGGITWKVQTETLIPLIDWVLDRTPVLSPRLGTVQPYEAVVSKPSVLRIGGTYHMWLSVFSMDDVGYRLNYARSTDGVHWERFAGDEVLPLTPGGFDSKNQSYANVVEVGDELWMFYAGNSFGATGVGLATMKKADLRGSG